MSAILWIGSLLGLALGSVHGIYLYRHRLADARASSTSGAMAHLEGAYYGLWALALWVVFGSYVLVLWLIGAIIYSICRIVPRRRPA